MIAEPKTELEGARDAGVKISPAGKTGSDAPHAKPTGESNTGAPPSTKAMRPPAKPAKTVSDPQRLPASVDAGATGAL